MAGDERYGGEMARAVNAGLREHYLSHVAGLFIGLRRGLQQSRVSHEVIARAANDWIAFRSAREEPQYTPAAVPASERSNDGTAQESVAGEDDEVRGVRAQAVRTSELLTELWTEDFPEQFPDVGVDDMLGMALAHAIHKGWIEPDITMSPFLLAAEKLLEAGSVDD